MSIQAKTIVDSFREVVQDLLVPELKAVRVSVDSLRTEMQLRDETLRAELKLRDENLRAEIHSGDKEMQLRDEKFQESIDGLRSEIQLRDERTHEIIRAFGQKLDFAIDIRERLVVLEARLPRQ